MSIQEVSAEQLAEFFHKYHYVLAPDFGCNSLDPRPWNDVSPDERKRMVAAARLALLELEFENSEEENSRKYFAKPGQAEWGC